MSNETEVAEFLDSNVVTDIVEGIIDGNISFHSRPENTKRVKVFQESVDFGAIKGLLASTRQ